MQIPYKSSLYKQIYKKAFYLFNALFQKSISNYIALRYIVLGYLMKFSEEANI